jgi:tRNA nucleotidyltransferase (CCA-adding enzyme)
MSDYLFMLDSHLSADQNRVLEQVQAAAGAAGVNLFLTGGGMRDMMGGFRIRDLDFSVEGNALKVAKKLEEEGARIVALDEIRRTAEMVFANSVTGQIGMSRKERYAKAGGKPQVTPASIQEDLRGRDFTINAIALSLNRASRGLLLDPTNGLADLGHREMRSTHPYVFYDDPVRLLRLIRLRIRFGFTVEERTQAQYENARAAKIETLIPASALSQELQNVAGESNACEIVQALDKENLLTLFSPALTGPKYNLQGLGRLEKAERLMESANLTIEAKPTLFLHALTAKMTPKEKSDFFKAVSLPKSEIELLRNLEPQAHKVELALRSARVRKPSHVYEILSAAPPASIAFLLAHSEQKAVQERVRNYLQKYLPIMLEASPSDWQAIEGQPGTPKYNRNRQAFLAARLDVRPRKPTEMEAEAGTPSADAVARERVN